MQKLILPASVRMGGLKNRLAGLLLAMSLTQLGGNAALAQNSDTQNSDIGSNDQSTLPYLEINPLFSSATRRPIPLAEVLASVSIITRAQIEQAGAYDVAELLASQPGIEVTRNGGPGAVRSIFLRGQNSKSLVVLVDGVQAQSDNYGGLTVSNIPASQIERIEIVRGTAGALFGEGAIGGVVHIFTRNAAGRPAAYAKTRIGAYQTKEALLGYGGQTPDSQFDVSVATFETAGFSSIDTSIKSDANPDRDGSTRRSFNGRFSRQLSERLRVGGHLRRIDSSNDYDNTGWGAAATQTHKAEGSNTDYGVFAAMRFASQWQSRLDISQSDLTRKQFQDGAQKSLASGGLHEGKMRRIALSNSLEKKLGESGYQSFTAGLESTSGDYQSYGTTNYRDGVALAGGWLGQFERFDLQANLRRDRITAKDTSRSVTNEANSWLMGAGWFLNDTLKLTASQSTAFRAPAGAELYGYGGNLNLESETHKSSELGLSHTGPQLFTRLVRFDTSTKDAIVWSGSSYANLPDVENKGWELYAETRLAGVSLEASHVWQKPINKRSGAALLKRARHYGSLRANKSWKGYEGQLNWRYTGATTDYPSERLPGYQLVDLRVARKLSPAVRVSLKIDNLLDKTYQNTYAYNAPGRSVFLSLTWRQAKRNGS